jgi:hypothetical protein
MQYALLVRIKAQKVSLKMAYMKILLAQNAVGNKK